MKALTDAGTELKADLWQPDDAAFLASRAKDLVGLAAKAETMTDPNKKAAYLAAAKDTLVSVKLLAQIRLESLERSLIAKLEDLFKTVVLPAIEKLLPPLLGMVML
ncbi:MAG TPA: hypothetical protein VFP84_27420 [Kofleriaceae bacterium]|nr:hypothetical protein [Kofleriaceae bacterium]